MWSISRRSAEDKAEWMFWVISTQKLNESIGVQKAITLSRLKKLTPNNVSYSKLYIATKNAAGKTFHRTR